MSSLNLESEDLKERDMRGNAGALVIGGWKRCRINLGSRTTYLTLSAIKRARLGLCELGPLILITSFPVFSRAETTLGT